MAEYTQEELYAAIQEVGREIGYRKYCYPNWVLRGKLTQEKADVQLKNMRKAYEILKGIYNNV